MKKTIGITLVIMIATSLLAGCGERAEENRAEEVKEPETETVQNISFGCNRVERVGI